MTDKFILNKTILTFPVQKLLNNNSIALLLMKWLFNLWNFFQKKQNQETVEKIPLNELKEWLEVREQELVNNYDLNQGLSDYIALLKDKRWFLECQLEEWQKKVTPLEKNYNSEEVNLLFLETRKFLELLTFLGEITLEKVLRFNYLLEPKLKSLIKDVENSDFANYFEFILTDEDENSLLNPLLKALIELDGVKKNFEQKVVSSGYNKMNNLNKTFLLLNNYTLHLKHKEQELNRKKERLFVFKQKKDNKEKELLLLKEEPDYKHLNAIKEKRKDISQEMEENKDSILAYFSKLKQLLIKSKEFVINNRLVNGYLEDPLLAFLNDMELEIKNVFQHLKVILSAGKLSFEPEEISSFLEILEKKDNLDEMQHKHFSLNKNLHLVNQLYKMDDFILKVEDLKYRLDHFSKQITKFEEEVLFLEEKINELREERNRGLQQFQSLIKVSLKRNLLVTNY